MRVVSVVVLLGVRSRSFSSRSSRTLKTRLAVCVPCRRRHRCLSLNPTSNSSSIGKRASERERERVSVGKIVEVVVAVVVDSIVVVFVVIVVVEVDLLSPPLSLSL